MALKQEICLGTAWAEGQLQPPTDPLTPGAQLQFSQRGMDASMLQDLYLIVSGGTYDAIADAVKAGQKVEVASGLKGLGGKQLARYHTAHYAECSAEFRSMMASLKSDEVRDIAHNWYGRLRPSKPPSTSGKYSAHRHEILQNLTALARVAQHRNARLLFRFEYKSTEVDPESSP